MGAYYRFVFLAVALVGACEPIESEDAALDPASASPVIAVAPPPPSQNTSSIEGVQQVLRLNHDECLALDPRTRVPPRPVSLLLSEAAQLQSLLQTTTTTAKQQLLRRMAEDYVEVAAAAERDVSQTQVRDATTNMREALVTAARRGAIAYYTNLLSSAWSPPYPLVDEVQWYLALEYARSGDDVNARRVANDVLARSPASPWAARASFLLGVEDSDFANEAVARQHFEQAASSNDPIIARLARLRIGDAPVIHDGIATPREHAIVPKETGTVAQCTMDMECSGSQVCRDSRCVRP